MPAINLVTLLNSSHVYKIARLSDTLQAENGKKPLLCSVLTGHAPHAFTYALQDSPPEPPELGSFVTVNLRGKPLTGIIWDAVPQEGLHNVKVAEPYRQESPLLPALIRYLKRAALYTMASEGQILRLMIPSQGVFASPKRKPKLTTALSNDTLVHPPITSFMLQTEQQRAKNLIDQYLHPSPQFKVIVLRGVTGSGKTETFFSAAQGAIASQKQVLILLPEIMLAEQIFLRAQVFFSGNRVALWHSDLSKAQRAEIWQSWKNGDMDILVGTRSALHLPSQHLGLIVVDEEHDHGYKQEEGGAIYHARDLAILRAECENIPVVLSSATPSLETLYNLNHQRHYEEVALEKRFDSAKMPSITLINTSDPKLCPPRDILSLPLKQALIENFEQQQQSLLFLNRRGFSPAVVCSKCGTPLYCPVDQHVLAYHLPSTASTQKKEHSSLLSSVERGVKLLCHLCGRREPVPSCCPHCKQETTFIPKGYGVERIAEEVSALIPRAHIAIATSDTLNTKKKLSDFLQKMDKGEIDLIVGTQLIAKGLHFPNLSLVGVIHALQNGQHIDFRFGEKSVQMIQQVTGRAGRDKNKQGRVIIQHQNDAPSPFERFLHEMHTPDAQKNFIKEELHMREHFDQPPYTFYLALILSTPRLSILETYCRKLYKEAPKREYFTVFPPIPAPIPFYRNRYRMRFLIKSTRPHPPQKLVTQWLLQYPAPHAIRLHIDVNPFSFF